DAIQTVRSAAAVVPGVSLVLPGPHRRLDSRRSPGKPEIAHRKTGSASRGAKLLRSALNPPNRISMTLRTTFPDRVSTSAAVAPPVFAGLAQDHGAILVDPPWRFA